MTNNITKANDQTANIGDRPQAESGASKKFLYCLSLVNNQKNDTARRGAVVKAISICTRYPFIQIFKPAIVLALQRFYENSTEKVLAELYQALNAMDLSSMPAYNDYQKQILRANDDKSKLEFSTVINYVTKMNIKIPIALLPDEVGDCKLIPLVKKFGSQVMLIYNGLLTQKRILFLGFDSSAGELCEYVLAACSMLCPPLKGLIHRAFPYTNLTYLNFLEIPGYIAGVANPMFEMHMDWWDLLCNIKTGKITVNSSSSSSLTQQQLPSPLPSPTFPSSPSSPSSPSQQHVIEKYTQFDNEFIAQVNGCVVSHYGEDMVRILFQNYTQHILDMAFDEEEFPDDNAKQIEMEANRSRIEQWKKSVSYETYVNDRKTMRDMNAIKDSIVPLYVKRLKVKKCISEKEMLLIYKTFLDNINTEEQATEFLSFLPEAAGGCLPISASLFHTSEEVRTITAKLFHQLDKLQVNKDFMARMNFFLFLGYDHIAKQNMKL